MKAVILDMYGVIVKDTGEGFLPFVNSTFPNLTLDDIYKQWDRADIGEISSLKVFDNLGFKGDIVKTEREYLDTVELNEGFHRFASEIKKNYKLAIISNDSSEWSRYLRDKYKINEYFDVISISGDMKIKKPDERIFKMTIDKLGCLAEECTYVDDREEYLEAAKALGMDTVLFNSRDVQYEGKTVVSFKELAEMLVNS